MLDFTEWDHLDPMKLAHAAHLWIALEPDENKVPGKGPVYLIFQRLKQEVHDRRLLGPNVPYPKGCNRVPRADLKDIAESWGAKPAFLFPDERSLKPTAANTSGAKKRCERWLVGYMQEGPPKKPKKSYRVDAIDRFGVSFRAFNHAWANAIAETGNTEWSKAGRKS